MPSSLCPRSWKSELMGRIESNVWNMWNRWDETKHPEQLPFFTDSSGQSPNVSRAVRFAAAPLFYHLQVVRRRTTPTQDTTSKYLKHFEKSAILMDFSQIFIPCSVKVAPVSHWSPPRVHLVEQPAERQMQVESTSWLPPVLIVFGWEWMCRSSYSHWSHHEMLFCKKRGQLVNRL